MKTKRWLGGLNLTSVPLGQLTALHAALWTCLTMMWAGYSHASSFLTSAMLAVIGINLWKTKVPSDVAAKWPGSRPTPSALGWLIALILPAFTYFLLTAGQEFPFAGDYDHHMYMAQGALDSFGWLLPVPPFVLAGAILFAPRWPYAYLAYMAGAVLISLWIPPLQFILRYPAGLYSVSAPFNALFRLGDAFHPMLGLRLANVLALPLWLCILRPVFLQRWPDARAFVLGAAFLFQKEWVYYLSSDFLEPWALIFVFLALESLLDARPWQAVFLAALGTAFKEQCVFILASASLVAIMNSRKTLGVGKSALSVAGFFLPFFCYWSARSNSGVFRSVGLAPLEDAFDPGRLEEYAMNLNAHLGVGGWTVLVSLVVLNVVAALRDKKHQLAVLACLAAVIGAETLYLVDKISLQYSGYPRFHYLSWPLLAAGPLALWQQGWQRGLTITAAVFALLNTASAHGFYRDAFRPDYYRNFLERFQTPLFFPIGKLLSEMPPDKDGWSLIVASPVDGHWLRYSLAAAYGHDLGKFRQVELRPVLTCICPGPKTASLILDVYQPDLDSRYRIPSTVNQTQITSCIQELQRTCSKVVTESATNGFVTGAIGFRH